jgi:eukaryotic-like serine/threonine-protein kinase
LIELQERLSAALADRYVLECELGHGGMATVYRARDLRNDREVALKILRTELANALGPERFLREIRIAARLNHPNILSLYDSGTLALADGALGFYYAMPLVEGESLRRRLIREGQLPIEEALRIASEISAGLEYAHEQGIIHRDIKPENILLSGYPRPGGPSGDWRVVLADFGIAKAVDVAGAERLTETGLALGTPSYMSPEQASADSHIDHRTDLYALGCVLYEMLAGEPPFSGATAQAILARHVLDPVPSLRTVRPTVPEVVEQTIARVLAKVPADRFATAGEFREALTADTRRPVLEHAPRWRRRSLVAATAGLIGAAALGLSLRSSDEPSPTPAGPELRVLVVLPFRNLGPAADQYFAEGLTEELTSRLAGLPGLRVIAPGTAAQYGSQPSSLRQVGRELGAGYVLQGSVRWERSRTPGNPGRLRVTPQLIQVSDESHRWAQVYDAEFTEVFGVQSRIAEAVTEALGLALGAPARAGLAKGGTHQAEAYDFYLRGNEYLGRSTAEADLRSAVSLYRQAVALDPAFAEAQARLSRAHAQMYWHYYDHTEERLRLAKAAADAARAIAPDLPETHIALGYYHYWAELDYDAALREFEAARRQQPSNADLLRAIGLVERRRGRWNESVARFSEALRYDPRSGSQTLEVGDDYLMMRMYPEAEEYIDRAIALSPDWPRPYVYKAWLYVCWRGDLPRARAALLQALTRVGPSPLAVALPTGDRISTSVLTADSTFWPMIDGLSLAEFPGDSARYHLFKAENAHFRRARAAERAHGDSARALLEPRLRTRPDDAKLLAALALAYAHMGRGTDGIRLAKRSVGLLPTSLDAVSGPFLEIWLARVYMAAGKPEPAIEILARQLTIPSWITVPELRVDPTWDPLRAHPAFRRLTDSTITAS